MSSRVILADDEEMIREGLTYLVDWAALDCEIVFRASNGQEVIAWLESHDEPVDIVISDIRMPVTDGLDLARYIDRNCRDTTEIILLTGFADFSYAQAAIRHNVCDFVLKSAVTSALPAAVRKAQESLKQKEEQRRRLLDAETIAQKGRHTHMESLLRGAVQGQASEAADFSEGFQPPYLVASYEIASSEQLSTASAGPAILNVLSMCLKNYASVSLCVSAAQYASLVCLPAADSSLRELMKELHNIVSVLNNYTQYTVRIGLSARRQTPTGLADAYRESVAALNRLFNDHNVIALYGEQRPPREGQPALPDSRVLTDRLSERMQADRPTRCWNCLKDISALLHSGDPSNR
jgi:two-component system response regulator YesN